MTTTVAIIQARMTSTRFPGKVLATLGEKATLRHLIDRLDQCRNLHNTIIATPTNDLLGKGLHRNYRCHPIYEGHPTNVRERVLSCAENYKVETIVDITCDCPLIDPQHVDELIQLVNKYGYDYASNISPRTWPDGFDVQVYKTKLLKQADQKDPQAPHVGWQILNLITKHELYAKTFNLPAPPQFAFPEMRLTLDTFEDGKVLDKVFTDLGTYPSAIEVIAYMLDHPELIEINKHIKPKSPEEG